MYSLPSFDIWVQHETLASMKIMNIFITPKSCAFCNPSPPGPLTLMPVYSSLGSTIKHIFLKCGLRTTRGPQAPLRGPLCRAGVSSRIFVKQCHNIWTAEADVKIQLDPVKPDMRKICKDTQLCYSYLHFWSF